MMLAFCQHEKAHKHGKVRQDNQRYKFVLCNETFVRPTAKPVGNMRISVKEPGESAWSSCASFVSVNCSNCGR